MSEPETPNPILEASKKVREFVRTLIPADDPRLSIGVQVATIETLVRDTLAFAWADSVRDAWQAILDGNPNLKVLDGVAKTVMDGDCYTGNPICLPPGMKAFVCTVDNEAAVCLDYSMAYAVPLSSIYCDKVRKSADEAERTLAKMPPKITTVYSFTNGMTMVFDQFGKQMPEYQGKTVDVLPKLWKAGFDQPVTEVQWGS